MKLVQINRNYDYPDIMRQTPGGKGIWGDLKFVYGPKIYSDYNVVFNHPKRRFFSITRSGGNWLIIQEPPYDRNNYLKDSMKRYDHVVSAFDDKKSIQLPPMLPWLVDRSFDELVSMKISSFKKSSGIVCITSNSIINPGHEIRFKILDELRKYGLGFDVFGRGFINIDDKFVKMSMYKYAIVIENYFDNNYFTEKIFDSFLSFTMPIYFGCSNLSKYFPVNSYIQIDPNKMQESYLEIRKKIENGFYEDNISAILEARNLVLYKYQFFPMFYDLVRGNQLGRLFSINFYE